MERLYLQLTRSKYKFKHRFKIKSVIANVFMEAMTAQEHTEYRAKMRDMKTQQERKAYRLEHQKNAMKGA